MRSPWWRQPRSPVAGTLHAPGSLQGTGAKASGPGTSPALLAHRPGAFHTLRTHPAGSKEEAPSPQAGWIPSSFSRPPGTSGAGALSHHLEHRPATVPPYNQTLLLLNLSPGTGHVAQRTGLPGAATCLSHPERPAFCLQPAVAPSMLCPTWGSCPCPGKGPGPIQESSVAQSGWAKPVEAAPCERARQQPPPCGGAAPAQGLLLVSAGRQDMCDPGVSSGQSGGSVRGFLAARHS